MGQPSALVCSRSGESYQPNQLINLSKAGAPLLVQYDLPAIRSQWSRADLNRAVPSIWRYAPVLPADGNDIISLGEGWTPLLRARVLERKLGFANLWIKDEGRNPTDSFKARGLSCAVTMAKKLGAQRLAIPSAGNAAGALAAYAAKAGLEAHIFMPQDVPQANFIECKSFGANVTLVDGLISDCGRIVAERKEREGWFEVSTLKEPYRIEGKKTMGY
ncbi:MAG: threonine synthase, partial [Acidobacteriaceae bacterium]|nr:threonine synthase [Acidobacteriaceae bacterium]